MPLLVTIVTKVGIVTDAPEDWHPEDIKAAVRKTGVGLTELALREGLGESACRTALRRATPRADKAISDQIGVPLHEIWPSRYDEQGHRLSRSHERDQSNGNREGAHRLTGEAA
jgi:Ner family transcriptional regulator